MPPTSKSFFILFLVTTLLFPGCASLISRLQTPHLRVHLINSETHESLPGMRVHVSSREQPTPLLRITNMSGVAEFPEIKQTPFTLTVQDDSSWFGNITDSVITNFSLDDTLLVRLEKLITTITGKVQVEKTLFPVDSCLVEIHPSIDSKAYTGSRGRFTISARRIRPNIEYSVKATHTGFKMSTSLKSLTARINQINNIGTIFMEKIDTDSSNIDTVMPPPHLKLMFIGTQ